MSNHSPTHEKSLQQTATTSEAEVIDRLKSAGLEKNVIVAEMRDIERAIGDLASLGLDEITIEQAVRDNICVIALTCGNQLRIVPWGTMAVNVIDTSSDNFVAGRTIVLEPEPEKVARPSPGVTRWSRRW